LGIIAFDGNYHHEPKLLFEWSILLSISLDPDS
jgi:hypothetical protein